MSRKLSIIIPVYGVEKYLPKCIESVLNQTFLDFELILIDDGSPDKCGEICDYYAKKDNRIHVIHQENRGISAARNAGLNFASGEFIAFIDSDDWIDKDMYERLFAVTERDAVEIIACGFKKIYEDYYIADGKGEIFLFNNKQAIADLLNENHLRMEVWNKVIKRNLIGNLRFKENQRYEEIYFTTNLIFKAKKIGYIDLPKYNYLISRPDNFGNSTFSEDRLVLFDEFKLFINKLEEKKYYDLILKAKEIYMTYAMSFYFIASKQSDNRTIFKKIYEQFNVYYKEVCSRIAIIQKIKFILFKFYPTIYTKIYFLKNKFKQNYFKRLYKR